MHMKTSITHTARTVFYFCLGLAAFGTTALETTARAQPANYRVGEGSKVRFQCFGPKVTKPAKGRFSAISGQMNLDPRNLTTTSASLQVILQSITTTDTSWDVMFRAAGFLGVVAHPASSFEITRIEGAQTLTPNEWTRMRLHGKFTLRGVTKTTVVPARARWLPAGPGRKERVEVLARIRFLFRDHEVWVPRGSDEEFAGIGAIARVHAFFERQ